jgi:uncharacterized membrane protein YjjP (DUF1212 family)
VTTAGDAPDLKTGADDADLLLLSAKLLFENGQTTERTATSTTRLGAALGFRALLLAHWDELGIRIERPAGCPQLSVAARAAGVDIRKVTATMQVVDDVFAGRMSGAQARVSFANIDRIPPIGVARFALLAGAGAAALGVIFGTAHWLSLVLIAASAGMGACLRHWLAGITRNLFVQPFCAALLAGAIGALAVHLHLSSALRLVALCPCMVLVPGPHLLNGALDLAHGRLPLGAARLGYASLIILMICAGLLAGLAAGGVSLAASAPSNRVPLWADVVAAGVAVAAYGTFFAMTWRMLPIPILIGMLAHACHWMVIAMGGNAAVSALAACFVAGVLITPIADRLRLPFAALGFASVVSLIPGVFLFRMAGGLVDLVAPGPKAPDLLLNTVTDGMTAALIFLAMAFGLIAPKLLIEHVRPQPY